MKQFKIPSRTYKVVKSIRFPENIVAEVENKIAGKECTFSEFVVEAVKVALHNIKKQ